MLTSGPAQSATLRFQRVTWLALLLMVIVHIAGYAVVTTQIESRYA
jgi:hypothetical protein